MLFTRFEYIRPNPVKPHSASWYGYLTLYDINGEAYQVSLSKVIHNSITGLSVSMHSTRWAASHGIKTQLTTEELRGISQWVVANTTKLLGLSNQKLLRQGYSIRLPIDNLSTTIVEVGAPLPTTMVGNATIGY